MDIFLLAAAVVVAVGLILYSFKPSAPALPAAPPTAQPDPSAPESPKAG